MLTQQPDKAATLVVAETLKVCNLLMSSDLSIRFFMLGRSFKSVSNLVFSFSMSHRGTKRRRNIFPMCSKYRPLLPQIAKSQNTRKEHAYTDVTLSNRFVINSTICFGRSLYTSNVIRQENTSSSFDTTMSLHRILLCHSYVTTTWATDTMQRQRYKFYVKRENIFGIICFSANFLATRQRKMHFSLFSLLKNLQISGKNAYLCKLKGNRFLPLK